jgi:hypothetical protein
VQRSPKGEAIAEMKRFCYSNRRLTSRGQSDSSSPTHSAYQGQYAETPETLSFRLSLTYKALPSLPLRASPSVYVFQVGSNPTLPAWLHSLR